jgi:hypothetical protein
MYVEYPPLKVFWSFPAHSAESTRRFADYHLKSAFEQVHNNRPLVAAPE